MRLGESLDLTYCTNIHAGNGWPEVFGNVAACGTELKRRLSPDGPFGLGLRLSNRDCRELLQGDHLPRFSEYLASSGLYVCLLNGYPFGDFHGARVKSDVFSPDWRDEARVEYTLRLVRVLEGLLPAGADGGISTVPLSYKPWVQAGNRDAWLGIVDNVVRVAAALVRAERAGGRRIRLEIEPEPDGLVETSAEVVAFFERWLLAAGAPRLAAELGVSRVEAERLIRAHVCVCFDTCHFAVEYEDQAAAVDALTAAGVGIGRVQLSSALKTALPAAELASRLSPFADPVYLHQVVERRADGSLRRFPDLPDALATVADPAAREWRIHFHAPLFCESYGALGSTQDSVATLLGRLGRQPFTGHLEIETYTWGVLPEAMKLDLVDSIEREYRWVLNQRCARPPS